MREAVRTPLLALGVLLALTGASAWLSRVPLHGWETALALAIAVVKAAVVALVFMRLWRRRGTGAVALLSAAAMVAILVAFMAADIVTRTGLVPVGEGNEVGAPGRR